MSDDRDPDCASGAEVRSAIAGLGNQKLRLFAWGRYLVSAYKPFCGDQSAEDFYYEAITRTLEGKRKWKPKNCTFVQHLMGAMRSIASHLPDEYNGDARNVPIRAVELVTDGDSEDDEGQATLENVAGASPRPEEELIAKQAARQIEQLFEDDVEASLVLLLFGQGKTEPEIANDLGLTIKQAHAAVERIKYRFLKAAK